MLDKILEKYVQWLKLASSDGSYDHYTVETFTQWAHTRIVHDSNEQRGAYRERFRTIIAHVYDGDEGGPQMLFVTLSKGEYKVNPTDDWFVRTIVQEFDLDMSFIYANNPVYDGEEFFVFDANCKGAQPLRNTFVIRG